MAMHPGVSQPLTSKPLIYEPHPYRGFQYVLVAHLFKNGHQKNLSLSQTLLTVYRHRYLLSSFFIIFLLSFLLKCFHNL